MQQYEYKYVKATVGNWLIESTMTKEINHYAKEGWRYISWLPSEQTTDGHHNKIILVFERRVQ